MKKSLSTKNSVRLVCITALFSGVILGNSILSFENAVAKPVEIGNYDPRLSLAPLAQKLSPTVVNIEVSKEISPQMGAFKSWDYGLPDKLQTGQGSGFLISEDGYILTNNHVIEGADEVTVKMVLNQNTQKENEKEFEGKVVGIDDSLDIALIKIDAKEILPYVELGSSKDTQVGDWVVAIGNPFGLAHTVTSGIISAKGRVIGAGPYDDFLQTDASINPGNSGGPLFNLQGQVVGINTAINPQAQGIGFSVPIDSIKTIIQDLKEKGHASRGWLGVGLRSDDNSKGVYIGDVYQDTPAAKHGLQKGDLITHFDGRSVTEQDELVRLVGKKHSGDTVKFTIRRGGRSKKIDVVLGERPSEKDLMIGNFQSNSDSTLQIQVAEVRNFDQRSPTSTGLVVIQLGKNSPAKGKLLPGDVIVSINKEPIKSKTQLDEATQNVSKLELGVIRNGTKVNIVIPL